MSQAIVDPTEIRRFAQSLKRFNGEGRPLDRIVTQMSVALCRRDSLVSEQRSYYKE